MVVRRMPMASTGHPLDDIPVALRKIGGTPSTSDVRGAVKQAGKTPNDIKAPTRGLFHSQSMTLSAEGFLFS